MVDDLPSAGSRRGRRVGTLAFPHRDHPRGCRHDRGILALAAGAETRAPPPIVRRSLLFVGERTGADRELRRRSRLPANAILVNPHCRDGRGTTERSGSPSEAPSSRG